MAATAPRMRATGLEPVMPAAFEGAAEVDWADADEVRELEGVGVLGVELPGVEAEGVDGVVGVPLAVEPDKVLERRVAVTVVGLAVPLVAPVVGLAVAVLPLRVNWPEKFSSAPWVIWKA